MRLDVNVDGAIQLTARLERLNRSAFPVAVRSTLNDMAFEAKKNIPNQAKSKFTIRQNNLFKRFSGVNKAAGYNLNNMQASVGVVDNGKPKLAKGLATQETGGNLQGRKLIAHDKARISGSNTKKVKSKYHFSKIKIGTKNKKAPGSKYFRIKNTVFENQGKRLIPIYNYRLNRISRLDKKSFIKPSALKASEKALIFYKKNAEYQFNRALK